MKVNEIGASVDKEISDTSTPKVSYKDYLGLWEFLLEKNKFKVHCMTSAFDLRIFFRFVVDVRIYHYPCIK